MPSYRVPAIGQDHESTCWEACARMLCAWKYAADSEMDARLKERIRLFRRGDGTRPGWGDRGMNATEMKGYYTMLGMNALAAPRCINIHHALKWTPVIVATTDGASGHVIVVTGYDGRVYHGLDPTDVDFGTRSGYVAGPRRFTPADLGRRLGEGMFYF